MPFYVYYLSGQRHIIQGQRISWLAAQADKVLGPFDTYEQAKESTPC